MKKTLKILILEDNLFDAELNKLELRKTYKEFESRVVKDEKNFVKELDTFQPDLILSDYAMLQFTGLDALEIAKNKCPEIPFIIVTGTINETTAVKCMRWGAWDYVIKDNLTHLGHAVTNAIKLKAENEKKKLAEEALRASEERYRVLFETAKDSIFITDESGKIFNINQAACKSLGYTKAELLKMRNKDLDADTTGYEAFKEVRNGLKDSITFEVDQIRKDGTLLPVEVTGNFYTIGDKKFSLAIARDLSKRRQVEKALRNAKREKEIILDSLVEHVIYENKDMKILWANKAAYESVDLTRKEMVGCYCYEIWPKRSEPCPDCPVIKAMKTKKPHEIKKVTPDGRAWFIRGYPTQDEKGDIVGGIEVTFDITEHKRAEKALKESEEKYRSLNNNINIGVYRNTVGPKGKFIEANPAIISMFGYDSRENFLAGSVADLYQNPEDRKSFNEKMLKEGFMRNEELQLKKNDGTFFWCSISAVAVKDEEGQIIYYDGVIEDITERKQAEEALKISEQRYRSLVETSTDWIWELNLKGKHVYSNNVCEKILGYSPNKICETDAIEFVHPEDKDFFKETYKQAIQTKSGWNNIVLRWRDKDGGYHYIESSALPRFDLKGEIIGFIGVDHDITNRILAEEELKNKMNELEIFNDATVDRELMINELRKEINALLKKLGKEPKYDIVG